MPAGLSSQLRLEPIAYVLPRPTRSIDGLNQLPIRVVTLLRHVAVGIRLVGKDKPATGIVVAVRKGHRKIQLRIWIWPAKYSRGNAIDLDVLILRLFSQRIGDAGDAAGGVASVLIGLSPRPSAAKYFDYVGVMVFFSPA